MGLRLHLLHSLHCCLFSFFLAFVLSISLFEIRIRFLHSEVTQDISKYSIWVFLFSRKSNFRRTFRHLRHTSRQGRFFNGFAGFFSGGKIIFVKHFFFKHLHWSYISTSISIFWFFWQFRVTIYFFSLLYILHKLLFHSH